MELAGLGWEDKKKMVHDIIEKLVIYDSGEVEVKGCLPLFNQKVGYKHIGRHSAIAKRRQKYLV